MLDTVLVTGAAGFVGSNFVIDWFDCQQEASIVSVDSLTYAGNLANLSGLQHQPRHTFCRADIGDPGAMRELLRVHRPRAVVNFAAETHADRSVHSPAAFVQTNVVSTFNLLETVSGYFSALSAVEKHVFRFLHISTDEVYGSLEPHEPAFAETHRYLPNGPYAASKAAGDHLVRAYHRTYGLPTLTTNCSNNYGPRQFPEKLIPLVITRAIRGESIPIYGDGLYVRDWLYVSDHCSAIRAVLAHGRVGENYNIGGWNERTNLDVVTMLCDTLDRTYPRTDGASYKEQVDFVADRPGHDRRYAIDASKLNREISWKPSESFESGIAKTVQWYLHDKAWVDTATSDCFRDWERLQYGNRT